MPGVAAGGQGGAAWVPGMSMPPLGFGVVPQQPGGAMMMMPAVQVGAQQVASLPQAPHVTWHQQQQQQFVAAQVCVCNSDPFHDWPLSWIIFYAGLFLV